MFLVPFAVAFKALLAAGFYAYGLPAYGAVMIFLAMVIVGFIYAWKKCTFDWSLQARAEARAEAKALFAERKRRQRETNFAKPQPQAVQVSSGRQSPTVSEPALASQ